MLSIITATHKRAKILACSALPSILKQTCLDFEWIVINDGKDSSTRELIKQIESKNVGFEITYLEMEHSTSGEWNVPQSQLGITCG